MAKTLKKIRAWRQKTRELDEDDNDPTRMKINDETKIRITPFINYSRFFDLHILTNSLKSKDINDARCIMGNTLARDLTHNEREQDKHRMGKFYSPVTHNDLPSSNLGAITERLDELIGGDININTHGKLERTSMDKRAVREDASLQLVEVVYRSRRERGHSRCSGDRRGKDPNDIEHLSFRRSW